MNVRLAGLTKRALAINHQIPAPTLHFREGDHVQINVCNHLKEETALHWHGVLVPWQMDGVLGVSQHGIAPHHCFKYHFTLHQSGTYWYHAHAGFQEQEGLYGAFIIAQKKPKLKTRQQKDFVVLLSDYSNQPATRIYYALKKSGDYYSPRFPLQPSLIKFIHDYQRAKSNTARRALIDDYHMMQTMRMNIYDLSDVAYDAFLLNGKTSQHPWTRMVRTGDSVRLRFIGAAAGTIFRVKIVDANFKIINVDGNDVKPYQTKSFTIAPGETYDVSLHVANNKPIIIYAESRDQSGSVIGVLATHPKQLAHLQSYTTRILPFPEPMTATREMMMNMPSMTMNNHMANSHMANSHMRHSSTHQQQAVMQHSKYQPLIAAYPTNDTHKPITKIIHFDLNGYMNRFIWFINGVPEYQAKPIVLVANKRYRFVFTNHSMMHHPMHIHGHWFILRKGSQENTFDPLLHTLDVAPGETMITDVDTDASGQWFFHCHLLYHMTAGMSRVVQYASLLELVQGKYVQQQISKSTHYVNRPIVSVYRPSPKTLALVQHPHAHNEEFYFATHLDVLEDPFHQIQQITLKGLYGGDYNKLEVFANDAEMKDGVVKNANVDIFYWRLLSQFWSIKGGMNYFYRPAKKPYWQLGAGIEGVMPYFIDTGLRAYTYAGAVKLDIEISRDTQITQNFLVRLALRSIFATQTQPRAMIGSGLNQIRIDVRPYYRVMPGMNVFVEYETIQNYGAFRRLVLKGGEAAREETLFFGVSLLF